jgi:hypothetical protein
MDPRLLELQYRVEHEHADGSWGQMVEEERPPHDAAEIDPERGWSLRRVFRCTACNEVVAVAPDREPVAPDAG